MFEGGFFSKEETGAGKQLPRLTGCAACGLIKECQSPKLDPAGRGEKRILIISEIPCDSEDKSGRMFAGEATKYLKECLLDYGIDVEKDCRKIAAVSCRTPKGRQPTLNEVEMCRPRVMKEIASYKPHAILLMGNAAATSVIGSQWKKDLGGINRWRGWNIPDRHFDAWISPMFHPSFVLKAIDQKSKVYNPVVDVIFRKDLRRAMELVDTDLSYPLKEESMVRIIEDKRELVHFLEGVLEWEDHISIDFETTGLKPDAPCHKIVTCAISSSGDEATAFNFPENGPAHTRLREIFAAESIKKIAHNAKFEERWAHAMGMPLHGIEWCSMIASHVLDNRGGISSLKFQAYVQFGVADYDSHINHFLKSSEEGAYAMNNIYQAPRKELLKYNGVDTMLTFRLAELQMKAIARKEYR